MIWDLRRKRRMGNEEGVEKWVMGDEARRVCVCV